MPTVCVRGSRVMSIYQKDERKRTASSFIFLQILKQRGLAFLCPRVGLIPDAAC